MNFKALTMFVLISVACFAGYAQANNVKLKVNKPMNITYRLAYQDSEREPVLGSLQSVQVDHGMMIPLSLDNHSVVGIVLVSSDGHVLPDTANRFNQPNQCSMTTDRNKTSGEVSFIVEKKQAICKTKGGVFG